MNQFSLENKLLTFKVAKSSIFVRIILFIVTFLCFALPLFGIVLNVVEGNGLNFISVLVLGVFSLIGFYMLRISLWNNFGEEIIHFNDNQIEYFADYRWFKDGIKTLDNDSITYSIKSVGYEEDNNGVLVISNGKSEIESVVEIQHEKLENLIKLLQNGG
ncbi:hypothetical protein [Pedobacter sp. MW01-1-1]|uniref:hypothetical protein n=1 Tax=Pedobacter sp. MW01-1-1 TaxID=3383027 RepID=UPI003FF051FE